MRWRWRFQSSIPGSRTSFAPSTPRSIDAGKQPPLQGSPTKPRNRSGCWPREPVYVPPPSLVASAKLGYVRRVRRGGNFKKSKSEKTAVRDDASGDKFTLSDQGSPHPQALRVPRVQSERVDSLCHFKKSASAIGLEDRENQACIIEQSWSQPWPTPASETCGTTPGWISIWWKV